MFFMVHFKPNELQISFTRSYGAMLAQAENLKVDLLIVLKSASFGVE
jgi:hypothetical protein